MQATKEYDKLNRLNSIKHVLANGRNVDFTYTYNDAHQRDIMTREDGTYWDYDYDSLGQVSEAVPYWSDDTRVVGKQFEFDYDDIGNRTTSSIGGDSSGNNRRTTTYADNSVNQITSLTLPGYSEVQGVAPEFASVTVNSQSAERKGEYYRKEIVTDSSSSNLFTSVTVSATGLTSSSGGIFTPESPVSLSYDDYGNLSEDGRWKYEWSTENRLVKMYTRDVVVTDLSATSFQPQTIEFQYDELGRRISKDVYDGVDPSTSLVSSTIFFYDGWNLIAEVDDSGASKEVLRSYTWGLDLSGSEQGAGGVGGLLMVHEGSRTHFVAMDGNGNVSALTDGTTVTAEYEYGPFGEVLKVLGENGNEMPIRFSSKYQDFETGLVYYGFRYYSNDLGRWLNRDPIGERGHELKKLIYKLRFIHTSTLLKQYNEYNFSFNESVSRFDVNGEFINGWGTGSGNPDSPLHEHNNPFGPNNNEPDCFAKCVAKHVLGITVSSTVVLSGQPILKKRFVTPGSSSGTSIAGKMTDAVLGNMRLPRRLPTISGGCCPRITWTKSASRFVSRAVPFVGWVMLVYDGGKVAVCVCKECW